MQKVQIMKKKKNLSPFVQDAGKGSLDALPDLVIGWLRGSGGGRTGRRWNQKVSGFIQDRLGGRGFLEGC